MNYNKKSIEDINVSGKRVLCRCDFNVPTKNGKITSDKRIVAAMPTIKYLVDHNAKVILCSHMGKPKGEVKPELSLQVVADRISELLGKPVVITDYATSGSQLEDGMDGVIVPMDNTGCAASIAALLRDPARMQQLSENCKKRDYTNSAEVEKIYALMED